MATQHLLRAKCRVTITTWETMTTVHVFVPYSQGETWQVENRAIGLALHCLDNVNEYWKADLYYSPLSDNAKFATIEVSQVCDITEDFDDYLASLTPVSQFVDVVGLDSTYWAVAN